MFQKSTVYSFLQKTVIVTTCQEKEAEEERDWVWDILTEVAWPRRQEGVCRADSQQTTLLERRSTLELTHQVSSILSLSSFHSFQMIVPFFSNDIFLFAQMLVLFFPNASSILS